MKIILIKLNSPLITFSSSLFLNFILIITKNHLNAENLTCEFKNDSFRDLTGYFYTCIVNVTDIISHPNTEITAVDGNHKYPMTNDDVRAIFFWIADKESFLPKGIDKVFKNIEILNFSAMHLRAIHPADLKPLRNLRALYLEVNDLQVIQRNLFEFNLQLEVIYLNQNQISFIDPNVFNNLKKLRVLYLAGNNCEKPFNYSFTRQEVLDFIADIQERKCYNTEVVKVSLFDIEKVYETVRIKEQMSDGNNSEIIDGNSLEIIKFLRQNEQAIKELKINQIFLFFSLISVVTLFSIICMLLLAVIYHFVIEKRKEECKHENENEKIVEKNLSNEHSEIIL